MTKKFLIIPMAIILMTALILTGCGTSTPTTSAPAQTTTKAPVTTTTAAPATTTSAPATSTSTPGITTPPPQTTAAPTGPKPVYGGTLRMVRADMPKVLGYPPEFAPADSILSLPVLERLCEWDAQGNQIPVLAESWEGDPVTKTITWHLRKGVKFSDGTDFNAQAVLWNYQQGLDTKTLTDAKYVTKLEAVDDYTFRMTMSTYTSMMIENYGWRQQISPTAFQKAGGGDIEKSKAWARSNSVGTGPFMVTQYQRDVSMRYEKNPNYWRTDAWGGKLPYLDAMEVRMIPDVMTASATMEAKQADMWTDVAAVPNILDLTSKGLLTNWGPGMFYSLIPNSSDPNSPTSKKGVREAIEYAIDRPALANMIGQGKYEPLTQMAPQKFPGYVQGYNPRPYNPAKAKELLASAGYPNGFKTKIMATSGGMDAVTAIKAYLGAVGIDVTIDIADLGRYFGEVFGTGYKDDLVFTASGINPDATDVFVHFGPTPMTFKTGNIYKSPEYLALCDKALHTYNWPDAVKVIQQAVKQAGEDAMIVPIYRSVANAVMQPYVHSDYFMIHGVIWTSWDDWMDKK